MSESWNYIAKGSLIVASWIALQVAQYESIISKAFDQLFSLGLLVAILIVLFKEYKSGKKYNADRDLTYEDLVRDSIETKKDLKNTIQELTRAIENINKE